MTTSYKLYWLYAILIEVQQGNHELSFHQIIVRMITACWYSLLRFKLNLGQIDQLSRLVHKIADKYNISFDISENELYSFLLNLHDAELEFDINNICR